MDFKERVFLAKKEKGLSQEALAEIIGVSRQAVSKWETGDAMPDTDKLIALCHALQVDLEYLALGKAVTLPEKKANPLRGRRVILALGMTLIVGVLVGFLLGAVITRFNLLSAQKQQTLASVEISDVTISPLVDQNALEIAILPRILPEGLEIHALCENMILGGTLTIPCDFDGNYYRFTLEKNPQLFHYRITAVLRCGNSNQVQLPLLDIDGDSRSFGYTLLYTLP